MNMFYFYLPFINSSAVWVKQRFGKFLTKLNVII